MSKVVVISSWQDNYASGVALISIGNPISMHIAMTLG